MTGFLGKKNRLKSIDYNDDMRKVVTSAVNLNVYFDFSLNKVRPIGMKAGLNVNKTVSRRFKNVSASDIEDLKTNKIKKRSYNKMLWGV